MAEKFFQEGAKVVISGRKEATLKAACEKLGSDVSYVVADVSEAERAGEFLDACESSSAAHRLPGEQRGREPS